MAIDTALRFAPATPGLRVFLNGFLLVNDRDGEASTTRVGAFLAPGANVVVLDAGDDPQAAGRAIVTPGDDAFAAPLADVTLPDPETPGSVAQDRFDPPAGTPAWRWTRAEAVEGDVVDDLHRFLSTVAEAFAAPDVGRLLALLATKHEELGQSFGIGRARMDTGLSQGLATRREQGGLTVDLASPEDLDLVWSPDRTHVRPLRGDGSDALHLLVGGAPQPFELHVGRLDGSWAVLR